MNETIENTEDQDVDIRTALRAGDDNGAMGSGVGRGGLIGSGT